LQRSFGKGFFNYYFAFKRFFVIKGKFGEVFRINGERSQGFLIQCRYEDNLLRESNLKQQKAKSNGFCGKKITFSYGDDC
jgi:hypothetical protein